MTIDRVVLVAAGSLALAGVGSTVRAASDSYDRRQGIASLEQHADRLEARALSTKGGPQQELLMRRARLQELIDRLDRGERVDPREIDELLGQMPPS